MQNSSKLSIFAAVTLLSAAFVLGQGIQHNELDDSDDEQLYPTVKVVRCTSGNDCQPDHCSVMGFQRFSEPECKPRGQLGSRCRPGQEADNKSLAFPDYVMECEDVYMQFCPCAEGLVCHEAECKTPQQVDRQQKRRRYRFRSRQ